MDFDRIYDGEEEVAPHEITERYVRRLEQKIREYPDLWMWSHRGGSTNPEPIMAGREKIVILNWNGAGHLRRFLPSVLASVPEGVGVVVADNGSTDDSLGVLEREFPAVGRIVLDRNYGFAGGYNRALEYLDADYFILLNSDVETPAGWVGAPIVETARRGIPTVAVA